MAHVSPLRRARYGRASRRALGVAALTAACLVPGCAPVNEGPQLEVVPPGIGYTTTIESARLPLPTHVKQRQVAYLPPGGMPGPTSVVITEYAGPATSDEVGRVRADFAKRYASTQYGETEVLTVAGHPAWGWTETQAYKGKVSSMGYTLIVAWRDLSFSIEVSSSDPGLADPARLREIATSFKVITRSSYDGWVLIGAGLILGAMVTFLWRAERRSATRPTDTVTRLLQR
jgi:hypothetical protein